MHRMVVRGAGGLVKWHYHQAATLDKWTLTTEPAGTTLSATVLSTDTFAVSQRPLRFVVHRPTGTWAWPVQSLQIADGRLTAVLEPQE